MMQVQGSDARVNGEGTYTDSRDHGKQFSVGRLGNFDKSEETKMTESKILLVLDKKIMRMACRYLKESASGQS